MAWSVSADPVDFDEAIAWFRKRVKLTKDEWKALEARDRRKAFFVSNVAQLDVVHQVWRALDEAIANGTSLDDFKKTIGAELRKAWAGAVDDPPWRLETIFRTNVQVAYGAGRYRQAKHPDVLADRPIWMFDAILDGRTTDICEACDGTKRPAEDKWWATHTPPLHFNCRSSFIALTKKQAGKITFVTPTVVPDEGFGDAPVEDGDEPTEWAHDKLAAAPAPLARLAAGHTPPPPPPPSNGGGSGGPPKKLPPPWYTDGKARPRGKIDQSDRTFDADDLRIAEYLANEGNSVRALSEKHKKLGHLLRRADAEVNGVRVEFKTVTTPTLNAVYEAVRRAAGRGKDIPQSPYVVVDIRGTSLTEADVVAKILRGRDRLRNRIDYVRILGDGYDVTISELAWP